MSSFPSTMRVCLIALIALVGCMQFASVEAQLPITWYSACETVNPNSNITSGAPSIAYQLVEGYNSNCSAQGYFIDAIATTGWSQLHIESNPTLSGDTQVYASGWLEGALPGYAARIYQTKVNTFAAFPNQTVDPRVYDWINQQTDWVQQQKAWSTNNYWTAVIYVYLQITGMYDGYSTVASPSEPLTAAELFMLNAQAEYGDILASIDAEYRDSIDVRKVNDFTQAKMMMDANSHCSALVRLIPDGSDMIASHVTWTAYATMLRVYKYYKGTWGVGAGAVQFSSYFGVVHSIDDFYQTDSNLIVMETTNNIANVDLYKYVIPQSVPEFVRVMTANRLAVSGSDWASYFEDNNSGTYNNQFMIVDNKLFTPGKIPPAGTLFIASQIPGYVEVADVTSVLNSQGYWASYNIPYFPDLWDRLGYGELVKKYGSNGTYIWSYQGSFRNLLFARDAPKVLSLEGMQLIMQSNHYQTDPLSRGSSELAIAARMDLTSGPLGHPRPSGAVDAKISSYQLMQGNSMIAWAKSGPTCDSQPPFQWSTSAFDKVSHVGLPDKFDFEWQNFEVLSFSHHDNAPIQDA